MVIVVIIIITTIIIKRIIIYIYIYYIALRACSMIFPGYAKCGAREARHSPVPTRANSKTKKTNE